MTVTLFPGRTPFVALPGQVRLTLSVPLMSASAECGFPSPADVAMRGIRLPVAASNTAELIAGAHRALGAIWRDSYRYKKAGVMLIDLVKAATVGDGLFDRRDHPRSLGRMRTLDALNARFGRDAVTFGRTGARRPWALRSDMLSRRYTTGPDCSRSDRLGL